MDGPTRSNRPIRTGKGGVEKLLRDYALSQAQASKEEDVLAALREEGITDLQGLVRASLEEIGDAGSVARTTFIYEQFIYKESLTLPDNIMEELRTQLRTSPR